MPSSAQSGSDIKEESSDEFIKEEPADSDESTSNDSDSCLSFNGIKSTPINCVSWPSASWEDGSRRSAFHPYKPTVLTNLQRGNSKANSPQVTVNVRETSWFESAGRGDISVSDIRKRPVNEVDADGLSALMWSAAYGQTSSVLNLIMNGANIHLKGNANETALHLAAAGGHHDVIKVLICKGANVNETDEYGNTPLLYAVYGDHAHAVDELLNSGANLFLANHEGVKAYNLAVERNCTEARLVLENYLQELLIEKHETKAAVWIFCK